MNKSQMKHCPWTVGLVCILMAACTRDSEPQPEMEPYQSPFIQTALQVDGRLTEPDWDRAETLSITQVFHPKDSTAPVPAGTVKILWDDAYLYLGFSSEDDDIWSFSEEPDDTLWLGDVVEFFIKPSAESLTYYEFVMAPNGTLYDARYASRGAGGIPRFRTWSSGARVATTIEGTDGDWEDTDTGYQVEVAIPWTAFTAENVPPVRETWTFGAFRYDYSKSYAAPYLLMSVPVSTHGFHNYEAYQDLFFVK